MSSPPLLRRSALALALGLAACNHAPRIEPEPLPSASATAPPAPESSAAMAVPRPPEPPPTPDSHPWPAGYTPKEIWETHPVVVDGETETWTLRWRKPPRFNDCAPWRSCECAGLAWGLKGALELVRERPGAAVERLDLAALRYGEGEIPGFVERPGDRKAAVPLEEVVKRPQVEAMALADYDHDGRATEFVFQVEYLACGNNVSVLVGISRAEPHLHVFHTVEKPEEPLRMNYLSSWEVLRKARGKQVDLPLISCNDHGGAGAADVRIRIDPAVGLHFVEELGLDCRRRR